MVFLITLPVKVPIGAEFKIPFDEEPIAALVLSNENATLPPIVLLLHVHVTAEPVLHLNP